MKGFIAVVLCVGALAAAVAEQTKADREVSTTFGLNNGPLEIAGKPGVPEAEKLAAFEQSKVALLAAVPRTRDETNRLVKAANELVKFRADRKEWKELAQLADEFATKLEGRYPDVRAKMTAQRLNAFFQCDDERAFDALAAEVAKMPLDKKTMDIVDSACGMMARRFADPTGRRQALWQRFVDRRAELEPALRARALVAMFGFGQERAAWKELNELAQATKESKGRVSTGALRGRYVNYLTQQNAWKELLPFHAEDAANPRAHYTANATLARTAFLAGERETCLKAIALCTNAQFKAQDKFNLQVLKAVVETKDEKSFAARIPALRGDMDVPTWFNSLRGACKYLYQLRSTPEMSWRIKQLVSLSFEQLWPEERVRYTATYVEEAPSTAEGALRTGLFTRLKTENRLGKYSVWDWMGGDWMGYANRSKDSKRLKSVEKPHLEADVPGKEGCVVVCYDACGVHFYVKLNDPEAWKTRACMADGLYFECSIQTGDEASWHWEILSARHPENKQPVEWDSPQFGRKMTCDYVKNDVYVGNDCYVVHVFAPWLLAYDRLPTEKGAFWRFVGVCGWAGQFGSIGGSNVHELGRGMQLDFEMSDKAKAAVKLGVLRAAAGEFETFAAKWENAEFWADPHLGDAKFYDEVVKPYLAEVKEAAKAAMAPELSAADVDRLSAHLWDFSDTRLVLDAKRADWLKTRYFAE